MDIRLGIENFFFRVKEIHPIEMSEPKKCYCKESLVNSVLFPCTHTYLCYDCAKVEKKCRICSKDIKEFYKFMKISG